MPPITAPDPEVQMPSPAMDDLEKLKPSPVLRIHLDELSHPATRSFLTLIDPTRILQNAITHITKQLYASQKTHIPPTRSVTLILRSMDGVAYTTGIPLDNLHKEIHLSLSYAGKFLDSPSRFRDELIGVVTHEMVHAYQWDALGSAPGGLIEGIADFVRLKAGLAPPHWKRAEVPGRWDEGYQRTAYFLEWLEGEYVGSVARINEALRERLYNEEEFWEGIFGKEKGIKWLFKKYRDSFKEKEDGVKEKRKPEDGKSTSNDAGVLVELEDGNTVVSCGN